MGREYDAATIFAEGRIGRPERTQNGAASWDIARFRGMLMGNFINEAKSGVVSEGGIGMLDENSRLETNYIGYPVHLMTGLV